MNHERYMDKGNRDHRAKELKAKGYVVTRRSSGPCELHPMYVKDFQWQHSLDQTDMGTPMLAKIAFQLLNESKTQEVA